MSTAKQQSKGMIVLRHLLSAKWFVSVLAVVVAFALGAVLIVMAGASVGEAYFAMFRGAIFDPTAATTQRQIKPITDSLFYATPLIIGGLGLAFGFRAGLFNIGGQGQVIFGALAAAWIGLASGFPPIVHTMLALFAAMLAGAAYAGIAGVLKARTGANEVIVTIMLNSIAFLALGYTLSKESWQVPGSHQPQTPNLADTAVYSHLLPSPFKLHSGILVAVIAVVIFWWLIDRSTIGMQVRAVGANPAAARTAGIPVGWVTTLTMAISGAFMGVAGANEALGTIGYVSRDVAGSIGFDAITVALLGRNKPLGTLASGLLFGAFKAGGYTMQAKGVPIDMILILQSVIVLLIAAPALVRWIFHLPRPSRLSLREELAAIGGGGNVVATEAVAEATAMADSEVKTEDASVETKGEAR
ncbi:Galactoside transport system permease protein mglC [Actinomyces bovis]|uniref:Galactoside transport system permease protein mglC n=1 Tax=Actinomyces bovis TaxID=1658 RepID=A0ABY1VMM4_9ACTO|nr:ABC transporter permease [Actinomyces bovis]SPT52722.1 Galactoside transport system permease protein mglC [Actinomyces bovis]VEG54688.1 Galactoside transport system permease protein mglC [Actinomyces israelii]